MDFIIREINPTNDLVQLSELLSSILQQHITAEQLHATIYLPTLKQRRTIAVDSTAKHLGYCLLQRMESMPRGQFSLWIATRSDFRRQGIATQLYDDALRYSKANGIKEIVGDVKDNDNASLDFVRKLGFEVIRHRVRAFLDLVTFDETLFVPIWEQVKASGIHFRTLAEIGDTNEARRNVYVLNRTLSLDIPGRGPFFTFEEYVQRRFEREWYRADGITLAIDGDKWIGLNQVSIHPNQNMAFIEMTGVAREYRGRKIAQALELLAVRCAQSYGAAILGTSIDSENAPMLAISRKLGYQPKAGSYTVKAVVG